jgi:hypothetical protein
MVRRRRLEKIRRGLHDSNRQRAKVVGRAHLDHALLDRFQDTGDQHDPHTMAQLNLIESKIGHLPQHRIAVLVTV